MAESWRWQLRDAEGQWVKMGSKVKWLDRGRTLRGTVVGSPRENVATIKPDTGGSPMDIDVRRITVDTPTSPQGIMEVEEVVKVPESKPKAKAKPKLKWTKIAYKTYEAPGGFEIYQESGWDSGGWVFKHLDSGTYKQEIPSFVAAKKIAEEFNADYDPVREAERRAQRAAERARYREQKERERLEKEAQVPALTTKVDAELTAQDPLAQSVRVTYEPTGWATLKRDEAAEKIARDILLSERTVVRYEALRGPVPLRWY